MLLLCGKLCDTLFFQERNYNPDTICTTNFLYTQNVLLSVSHAHTHACTIDQRWVLNNILPVGAGVVKAHSSLLGDRLLPWSLLPTGLFCVRSRLEKRRSGNALGRILALDPRPLLPSVPMAMQPR